MKSIIDIQKTGSDGSMKGKFISKKQDQDPDQDIFKILGVEKIC